jgi:hypothetical protein
VLNAANNNKLFSKNERKLKDQSLSVNVESSVKVYVHQVLSDLNGYPLRLWFGERSGRVCVAKKWDNGK